MDIDNSRQPRLHVLFTLDCSAAGPRAIPYGPLGWDAGARTIDAFCVTVLNAGFVPTLFVTPEAAAQYTPMCEDLAQSGAEIGLLIQPPTLRSAGCKHLLGAYGAVEQEAIIVEARRRFEDVTGQRPRSVRSAYYSANDATFLALSAAGFRQASLSSPGRRVPKHQALWDTAPPDPHFTDATSRVLAGALPLLEVPVTTDANQRHDGVAPDLAIENGTLDRWHAPLITSQLARHQAEEVAFPTICFVTAGGYAYYDRGTRQRQTLDAILLYLQELEEQFTIVPTTLTGIYVHYRTTMETGRVQTI